MVNVGGAPTSRSGIDIDLLGKVVKKQMAHMVAAESKTKSRANTGLFKFS